MRPSPPVNPSSLKEVDSGHHLYRIEHMSYSWIRASDINSYVYCRRSWWLHQRKGVRPQNVRQLQAGTRHHQQHGRLVSGSVWVKRLAFALLIFAMVFLVMGLLNT